MSKIKKSINVVDKNNNWQERLVDLLSKKVAGINELSNEEYKEYGNLSESVVPKSLYKYKAALYEKDNSNNKDLNTIEDEQLWLSSPETFNDPFDCQVIIGVDDTIELINSINPSMKLLNDKLPVEIQKKMHDYIEKETSELMKSCRESNAKYKDDLRVASFCERKDLNIMWGHYANSHKGICIEYNTEKIFKDLKRVPAPVLYRTKHLGPLNNTEEEIRKFYIKSMFIKSVEWAYEKEWRIVLHKTECGIRCNTKGVLLDFIKPSSISIGCNASEKLKAQVIDLCKTHGIESFQMKKDEKSFSLLSVKII